MSEHTRHPESFGGAPSGTGGGGPGGPPPGDEIDALLREWHQKNAQRAAAGRETLLARLRADGAAAPGVAGKLDLPPLIDAEMEEELRQHNQPHTRPPAVVVLRRVVMNRTWMATAAAILLAVTLPLIMLKYRGGTIGGPAPASSVEGMIRAASFDGYLMCPEGGRLDARDPEGNILGPCALTHTDVSVDVSGFLTRVTVKQKYHNPYQDKIEALYTFPLSERSAVDRMKMIIGNREIEGQVKERQLAKQIYEQAKAQGRIASLLEQERPNIFTQSIANLEPGADIDIAISYVETTRQVGGVYEFDFPTTITPRYTPGSALTGDPAPPPYPGLPPNAVPRRGLVLLAPATISELRAGDTQARGTLSEAELSEMLRRAVAIRGITPASNIWYTFKAAYQDGSAERGTLYTDGSGDLNGRWFAIPERAFPRPLVRPEAADGATTPGAPFARDTDRVPDASRVSPMPAKPPMRAGHDISITVNIDTGGPVLGSVTSALHDIVTTKAGSRATIRLKNDADIPNRDFVLKWRQESREVEPAVFTTSVAQGNFFAVQLTPPPVANDDEVAALAVPRELMFVLDTSGSMKGRSIEKAKEVLSKALGTLRPRDTFNIIKFNTTLTQLWPEARSASPQNIIDAQRFYANDPGSGGTEIVNAVNAAFSLPPPARADRPGITPIDLANLPADGRRVVVDADFSALIAPVDDGLAHAPPPRSVWKLSCGGAIDIELHLQVAMPATRVDERGAVYRLRGRWDTMEGRRVLVVESASVEPRPGVASGDPYRLVVFLTDGLISNETEVLGLIDAVQKNGARIAVFPFAIGNGPNRYLLESMARLGRGEVDYVYQNTSADEVIERFNRRIQTPVLTSIHVEFSPNLNVLDMLTALGGGGSSVSTIDAIPDLFDVKPLTIVGRYNQPGQGTVTISGMTSSGPYRRVVNLVLPAAPAGALQQIEAERWRQEDGAGRDDIRRLTAGDTIATLWARAKVEQITDRDLRGFAASNLAANLRSEIITLGETFNLMTPYTSFVAVDRLRVTVGGKARLVHIPIELTAGTEYSGFFGGSPAPARDDDDRALLGYGEQLTVFTFQPQPGQGGAGDYLLSLSLDETRAKQLDGADAFGNGAPVTYSVAPDAAGATKDPTGTPTTGLPAMNDRQRSVRIRGLDSAQHKADAPSPPPPPAPAASAPPEPAKPEAKAEEPKFKNAPGEKEKQAPAQRPAADEETARRQANKNEKDAGEDKKAPRESKEPAPPAAQPAAPAGTEGAKALKEQEELRKLVPQDAAGKRRAYGDAAYRLELAPGDASAVRVINQPTEAPSLQSTYFGVITQDRDPNLGQQWKLKGIDPAHAADAGKVLDLYFLPPALPPNATVPDDKAVTAAAPIVAAQTSHDAPKAAPEPARQRVVLLEHVVIRIAEWVRQQKIDEAKALAVALADAVPDNGTAEDVRHALTADNVTPAERDRQIADLGMHAEARLKETVRESKLQRRLEPELLKFARGTGFPTTLSGGVYDGAFPAQGIMVDGGLLVSILVDDTGEKTRAELTQAGLRVESFDAQSRVIVGVLPLGRLADVALVDGVKRMERTREEGVPSARPAGQGPKAE